MRDGVGYRLAGRAGQLVFDALLGSARFDIRGEHHYRALQDAGSQVIFVLWHGRLLPLTYLHRGQDIATLISRSGDGEYIARVVERWGYRPVRGSSSRGGGTALRTLVRHARAGRSLAFTPDGPRGPQRRMKPGVLAAARLTGLPIIPIAGGTDRAWWFESWDRFLVPKPFARIRVAYGEPHEVPRHAGADELERRGRRLEAELNRLSDAVDAGGDA